LPTASTADQKAGVVSSMIVFRTGCLTSPFSTRYASRPAYFALTLVVDVPLHETLHVHAEFHVLQELFDRMVLRLHERVRHPHDRLDVVVNRPSRAVAPGVHGRRGLAVLQKLRDAALLVEVAAAR